MATEIRVPALGESVTEATVAQWFKAEGDSVSADEPLVELETDKVTLEVPAPASGVLSLISVKPGETVEVGALLGNIGAGQGAGKGGAAKAEKKAEPKAEAKEAKKEEAAPEPKTNGKQRPAAKAEEPEKKPAAKPASETRAKADAPPAPSARRVIEENALDISRIEGTGKGGRITKEDALKALELRKVEPTVLRESEDKSPRGDEAREKRVPMSRLRRTIAQRLKDAQNTAAMLTTFNEVDMSAVMETRRQYKEDFERRHGVKLGFMSFFVKACVAALKDIPAVNAEIDGTDILYKDYYDIGVAVGTERGLVVPVIRDAEHLSLADIEKTVNDFGVRARDGKLKLEELQGGTFTISNGGVYGSLMSTPILNAPQSGILGMHKIEERPVAIKGSVVIRPMMYLALSYDHRLVDGKEAVTFLVRVKELIEDPQRLVLDV